MNIDQYYISLSHSKDELEHGLLDDARKKISSYADKLKTSVSKLTTNKNGNTSGWTWQNHKYLKIDNGRYIYKEISDKTKKASEALQKATESAKKGISDTYNKVKTGVENAANTIKEKTNKGTEYGVSSGTMVKTALAAACDAALSAINPLRLADTAKDIYTLGRYAVESVVELCKNMRFGGKYENIPKRSDPVPSVATYDEIRSEKAGINPGYSPNNYLTANNCANCSAAYELKRRGYDVEADTADVFDPNYNEDILSWFEGETVVSSNAESFDELTNEISEQGPGARGMIIVSWPTGGGHAISYEIDSEGLVHIIDCQSNTDLSDSKGYANSHYIEASESIMYFRTDNVDINDSIVRTVKEKKKNDNSGS